MTTFGTISSNIPYLQETLPNGRLFVPSSYWSKSQPQTTVMEREGDQVVFSWTQECDMALSSISVNIGSVSVQGNLNISLGKNEGLSPTARRYASSIYDSVNQAMLIFGGSTGLLQNDLWKYDTVTETWSQLFPTGDLPPIRYGHTSVYDSVNHSMLMFGGSTGSVQNDLWKYDIENNSWTQLSPTGGPPTARRYASSIYDSENHSMLIFGGYTTSSQNDLWNYNISTNTWSQLSPTGSPPTIRYGHTAIYDSVNQTMIIFGGNSGSAQSDLWKYDIVNNSWVGVFPTGVRFHTVVYDSVNGAILVFGGDAGTSGIDYRNELWKYDIENNSWAHLNPTGSPPTARDSHTSVYDSVNHSMLVFGGYTGSVENDLWKYNISTNTWSQLSPTGTPPSARMSHSTIYDSVNHSLLVFGGYDGMSTRYNNLRKYNISTNAWTSLSPTGPPSSRESHSAIYDPVNQAMLIFGGYDGTNMLNQLWKYSISANTWTQLSPTGTPPSARVGHTAVYDSSNQTMLIFGGEADTGSQNDLWKYDIVNDSWTQLSPTRTPPSARFCHTAVYDSSNQTMVIFGGEVGYTQNDLWKYDITNNSWSNLFIGPIARYTHTAICDSSNQTMLMFGGNINDLWKYTPTSNTWTQLNPSIGNPTARSNSTTIYDSTNQTLLIFGGYTSDYSNDMLIYNITENSWDYNLLLSLGITSDTSLGTLNSGSEAGWVRIVTTPYQLTRNTRYSLVITGSPSSSYTISSCRNTTNSGTSFASETTSYLSLNTSGVSTPLTQNNIPANFLIVLNSGTNHNPPICYGRYNGSNVPIPGIGLLSIPSAGLSTNTSNLSADTIYYAYAYSDSGDLAIEASTTIPIISNGYYVKTGTTDHLLLGVFYTTTGPNSAVSPIDCEDFRGVSNVYNQIWKTFGKRQIYSSTTSYTSPSGTGWVPWSTNKADWQLCAVCWKSFVELNENIQITYPASTTPQTRLGFVVNGILEPCSSLGGTTAVVTNSSRVPLAASLNKSLSFGFHTIVPVVYTSTSSLVSYYFSTIPTASLFGRILT